MTGVNGRMNKARELKKQYGNGYLFHRYLSDRQAARMQSAPPLSFSDTSVASLEIGCVRLDAVLFRSPTGVEMAYDILVRETPGSLEWICYDTIPAIAARESDMATALDSYVSQHGLAYTGCCFPRLEGKSVKAKGAPL